MKAIWKYPLELADDVTVSMPKYAEVLHAGEQGGQLVLWALVNPGAVRVDRHFHIVGTGTQLPPTVGDHIGTVPTMHGALVWHIFERRAS